MSVKSTRYELQSTLDSIKDEIEKLGVNQRPKEDIMKVAKKAEVVEKKTDGYTASEMAADLGIDAGTLRKALRDSGVQKPGSSWVWPTKKAASDAVKAVEKQLKDKPAKKEAKAPAKKEAAPAPTKKATSEAKAPVKQLKSKKPVVKKDADGE